MSFIAAIRVALEALFVNKGRSTLTSLGIVIGIMSVIAMVAAGGGAKEKLDERLDSVGKNLILLRPGGQTATGLNVQMTPLSSDDAKAIREDSFLKPLVSGVAESQPVPMLVSTSNVTARTTVVGNPPDVFKIRRWEIVGGRFLNEADNKKSANVCMIGETVRKKLFPNKKIPIGERIKVENVTLEVIGLLKPKGQAPTGADQDDQIFVPINTMQDKLALSKSIAIIVVGVKRTSDLDKAVKRIDKIMMERHRIKSDGQKDFNVKSIEEMASLAVMLTDTLNILVVVIASISLIVGGIGIMNIMLVSVTERTREIGIRMAVGATPGDIRNQFLMESMMLALVGGLLGVLLGIGSAFAITRFLEWPIFISPFYIGLAFGVSALIGVFFGFYPAAKASQLDPIEALRYE